MKDQTKLMSWFDTPTCPEWAVAVTVSERIDPNIGARLPIYWSCSVAAVEDDLQLDWKKLISYADLDKIAAEAGVRCCVSQYAYVGSATAALDRPAPDWVLKELEPLPEETADNDNLSDQLVEVFTGVRSIDEITSDCIGGIPSADEVFPGVEDNVNHPSHYTSHPSGVECIEITEHYDFCVGNAIKYLWRAGLKQDADKTELDKELEDLQKAKWYIDRKISLLTKNKEER